MTTNTQSPKPPRNQREQLEVLEIAQNIYLRLFVVVLFALAMGLLEAICVIYLRHSAFQTGSSPLAGESRMRIESLREGCTIVMLFTTAWLFGSSSTQRLLYFSLMFGVWDIFYYVGLKWLIEWPATWLEWDCLFLIPVRWYAPVLAPILVSSYFVVASVWLLLKDATGVPIRFTRGFLVLQSTAVVIWYLSFVWNTRLIADRGFGAVTYSWALFFLGLGVALVGLRLFASVFRVKR